jgi:Protein NO VEIN, C-terminal
MVDIIVFHTAWMDKYDGDRASLSAGGFKFAAEHGYGHEMYNFRNVNGRYYGYVPPTGDLHLEKHFNVSKSAEKLEGVTVVWTAPHPEQGGRAVVGVWRDATVYRRVQEPSGSLARRRNIDGETASYRCTAEVKNCVLLPPDARPIFVPSRQARGGESWPGQQKVFYPKPKSQALRRLTEILRDINLRSSSGAKASNSKRRKTGRSGWQADVEKRRRIEVAAVKAVGLHLEGSGFTVQSVEKDNLGYDLVATRGDETLHVEVKGRSGRDAVAELSVNEFDCLSRYQCLRKPKEHYRIAIVTDALAKPIIHEFVMLRGRTSGEISWWTLDGQWQLQFEERKAARLTAQRAQK